jgi:hypothetical protein
VLQLVVALVLTAHLVLVDIAMAGPLASVWLEWRPPRGCELLADRLALTLARLSIGALVGGMLLGGLLLALRWASDDRAYFDALAAVPASRLWFAGAELVFSLACLCAYAARWHRWARRRVVHRLLAVAAASNLLLHFPALFTIVSILSKRPELWGEVLDRSAYQHMFLDGEVLARVAHIWLAAFVTTGVVVMVLAGRLAGGADSRRLVERGAWLALVPALLELPAGWWLASRIPEAQRLPLLGDDLLSTGLFAAAILLALWLVHLLAGVALGDHEPRQIGRCVATLLAIMLLMVSTRFRWHEVLANRAAMAAPAAVRAPSDILHPLEVAFQ